MPTVFTIGHSNQPAAEFDALLAKHNIQCVIDVRSKPRSRFGQFNRNALERRLATSGIDYLYLGDNLGGHPDPDEFYEGGHVVYERVSGLRPFRLGIDRVVKECEQRRIVLMCAEEDPAECHRHPLLARMLVERGVEVLHVRRDGSVRDATTLIDEADAQLPFFELGGEDLTWVSPKRIRRQGQ